MNYDRWLRRALGVATVATCLACSGGGGSPGSNGGQASTGASSGQGGGGFGAFGGFDAGGGSAGSASGGSGGGGTPVCSGTPLPCAAAGSACITTPGCSDSSSCTGSAWSCAALYQVECYSQQGCYWSGGSCTGSAASCSTFAQEPACSDQQGCNWKSNCTGAPSPCELLDAATCSSVAGCYLTAAGPPPKSPCANEGANCNGNDECCVGESPGGACIYTGYGTECTPKCTDGTQCNSGCCLNGYCATLELCGGSCTAPGGGCNKSAECCGTASCVDVMGKGYGICAAACTSDAQCKGGCCYPTTSGKVCVPKSFCG
ncbi:MAG: hypothetical protein R3B13_21920 [Polyangiaceae bacterium]